MKAQTRFTPGPWRWGSVAGFNANTISEGSVQHLEQGICMVYGIPLHQAVGQVDRKRHAEGVANAQLISAAPEMYDALMDCEWSDGGLCPLCKCSGNHPRDCKLGNALRKARGE